VVEGETKAEVETAPDQGGHSHPSSWIPLTCLMSRRQRVESFVAGLLGLTLAALAVFSPSSFHAFRWTIGSLMGVLGLYGFRLALSSKPLFEMDSIGIVDRSSIGGGELRIRWDEMIDVRGSALEGTTVFHVRDRKQILRRAGWLRRIWMLPGIFSPRNTITLRPGKFGPRFEVLRERIQEALFEQERVELGLPPGSRLAPGKEGPD
jgi:hypothetical protein